MGKNSRPLRRLPDKENTNTCIALAIHAWSAYGKANPDTSLQDSEVRDKVGKTLESWLLGFQFTLDQWQMARQLLMIYTPVTRSKIELAIRDILEKTWSVDNYSSIGTKWTIPADDLFTIPGLSFEFMKLTQFQTGLKLGNEAKKPATPPKKPAKKPATTYAAKLKAEVQKPSNLKQKPTTIVGKKVTATTKPVENAFYMVLAPGSNIEEIKQILETTKFKITDIKFTLLYSGKSYQVRYKLPPQNKDFYKSVKLWPVGTKIKKWKGPMLLEHKDEFKKRLELSNINAPITSETVKSFISSKIYKNITFKSLNVTSIGKNKMVAALVVDRGNYQLLQDKGIMKGHYPDGISVRWLNRGYVQDSRKDITWYG